MVGTPAARAVLSAGELGGLQARCGTGQYTRLGIGSGRPDGAPLERGELAASVALNSLQSRRALQRIDFVLRIRGVNAAALRSQVFSIARHATGSLSDRPGLVILKGQYSPACIVGAPVGGMVFHE